LVSRQRLDDDSPLLRLCIIVPAHWDALMGGSQYQAKLLIEYLSQKRIFDIYYVTRWINKKTCPNGYRIVGVGRKNGPPRYGYFSDTPALLKVLKKIQPDLIYQMVGCAYAGVAAYYARRASIPMVCRITSDKAVLPGTDRTLRDVGPDRILERLFTSYGIRHAQAVVTQTNRQAELLEKNYGRSAERVIANYQPKPGLLGERPTTPTKIVWIANLKPIKRPELFVELAEKLAHRIDARFFMIGAPYSNCDRQREIERRISKLSRCKFIGPLDQDAVNSLLEKSHILVNTSTHEGLSNTFIQAWMRKVPVVSLTVDPDDMITKLGLGRVASESMSKLCSQVEELIDDVNMREKMGVDSAIVASSKFSEENIKNLLDVFYRRLGMNRPVQEIGGTDKLSGGTRR